MLLNCGVGEDSWERVRKSVLNIHQKDWCWSRNFNTLATWCKELTHWKRSRCCERLKAGGEGDDKGWDGWMVSLTRRTWVWARSRSWWWTGILVCYSPWGCKESDITEQLKWTELKWTDTCVNRYKMCFIIHVKILWAQSPQYFFITLSTPDSWKEIYTHTYIKIKHENNQITQTFPVINIQYLLVITEYGNGNPL